MSVEVSPIYEVPQKHEAFEYGPTELHDALEGIVAATNAKEAGEQQLGFEEIAKLFLDAHNDKVDALQQQKRELILDMLLDNPAEAFRGEFLQLKLLFENRTSAVSRYDGTVMREFCTQDHQRGTCDYLFRHIEKPDGGEKYQVKKVFTVFGQPDTITLTWEDGILDVEAQERFHGRTGYTKLDGEKRERVLAQLFYDTIHASALQIERGADEREENDQRAKGYLKKVRADEYILF